MTREELNSVRELQEKICRLEKDLRALRVASENLVPILDGLPHAKLAQSRVEKIAMKIVETDREHERLCGLLPSAKCELANKIMSEIDKPELQTLLMLRYVECCPFSEIGVRMQYSLRAVFKMHARFLKVCIYGHIDALPQN